MFYKNSAALSESKKTFEQKTLKVTALETITKAFWFNSSQNKIKLIYDRSVLVTKSFDY